MNCTICNAPSKILYENLSDRTHENIKGNYSLYKCTQCKLIFVFPQPDMSKLSEHYPDDYHVYLRAPEAVSKNKSMFAKMIAKNYFKYGRSNPLVKFCLSPIYYRISHLPHYKKNGRILDVGCGTGTRLPLFKLLGWEAEGIEPSRKAAAIGKSVGYKIHNGFFDELELPDNYCDALYLNNVFEHIPNLHTFLTKANLVLKNNGELILVVPNTKSLTFKIFNKNWYALDIPRHLYNFDEHNLTALLNQHHLKVKKISYCNFLGSFTSSLSLALGKNAGHFSKFDKGLRLLTTLLDPIMNFFKLGDWVVIHANVNKPE